MSVVSRNPFALLDAEDDSSSPKPIAAAAAAPAAQKPKPVAASATRGGKYYARGGAKAGSGNLNQSGVDEVAVEGQRKFEGGRGRGGRGGRGGARGAGNGGHGRPFDKHSQTGKTDSDKKIHQSWGGDEGKSELQAEDAAVADAAVEGQASKDDAWTAPAATDAVAAEGAASKSREDRPPRREREPEEEDNTLTLEQYLAQKKENDAIPKLEATRQAEGADSEIWKDAKVLKAEPEADYFAGKSKSSKGPRAKKDEKVFIDIEARFAPPSRGGSERGGRGGGRGDRGGERRGGASRGRGNATRNPRPAAAPAVDVADEAAFPSLS